MESETSKRLVNIIFVSGSEEKSRALAEGAIGGSVEGDVYVFECSDYIVKGYIRYPGLWMASAPFGITDAVIGHFTLGGSDEEFVTKYLSDRKGIPNKMLCCESCESCNDWKEKLGAECLTESCVVNTQFRENVVKSAIALHESLLAVFKKFDVNSNNYIDKEEIILASKELGHEITDSDAQEIVKTISKEGKIDFESFKKWWFFGKTDFNSFRLIIKAEGTLAKTFKNSAPKFSNYLKDLETKVEKTDEVTKSHFLIGHYKDINNGIGLSLHTSTGDNWTELTKDLPSYYSDKLALCGIELEMKDEAMVTSAVECIKSLLGMVSQMPQLSQAESMGISWAPRAVGKSILFEVTTGGIIDQMADSNLGQIDVSKVKWSGSSNMHLYTELTVDDIKNLTGEEIFDKLIRFRLTGEGEYLHLSALLTLIPHLLESSPFLQHAQLFQLGLAAKYLSALRQLNLTLGLDHDAIGAQIKKDADTLSGNEGFFAANTFMFEEMRAEALGMIEGSKEMVDSMIGPFKEILQGVNFDKISVFANISKVKTYVKLNLHLPGLTKQLEEVVLS